MKVILSRKGFDSSSGGFPSPVFPDGTMLSMPIPVFGSEVGIEYSKLNLPLAVCTPVYTTYFDLMNKLYLKDEVIENVKSKKSKLFYNKNWQDLEDKTQCHADPDILNYSRNKHGCKEMEEWLPMFGQSDTSQTVLCKADVDKDDLFLFFGKFQHVCTDGGIKFVGSEFHAIWGYMQVGKIISGDDVKSVKCKHPHTANNYTDKKANAIYIAKKTLDLPICKGIDGANIFPFHESRVLTAMDSNNVRMSVSKWKVDKFMECTHILYHTMDGFFGYKKDRGYFQSIYRGQEFVFNSNNEVERWLAKIFL